MRLRELHAHHRIAERIQRIDAPVVPGLDVDVMLQAFLVRRGTRHQVQQLVRMHDVRRVPVARLVADGIAARGHEAIACVSDSTSAK